MFKGVIYLNRPFLFKYMKKYLIVILTSSDIDVLRISVECAYNQTIKDVFDVYVVVNTLQDDYYNKVLTLCNAEMKDKVTKVVRTDSNGRPGKGHNSVIDVFNKTNYEYLVFCDGDDFLYPLALERIECQAKKKDFDAFILCSSSSKLSMSRHTCDESFQWNQELVTYDWKKTISIDRFLFCRISTDFNTMLATPCRLFIIKKSCALEQIQLFDERMEIYDDYNMFISFYRYDKTKKYEICFLCDPYIYMYNYTNPKSVSHRNNPKGMNDFEIHKTYDISDLDVTKIKVVTQVNTNEQEDTLIRAFERKLIQQYRMYHDKNFYDILNITLNTNNMKNMLFYDNGSKWNAVTIKHNSLRGTENALYQMSLAISQYNLNHVTVLTNGGCYQDINNKLRFDANISYKKHEPSVSIVVHQSVYTNFPEFHRKKNILYVHHDINVECIKQSFKNLDTFQQFIHRYVFVSNWQKNRYIQYYGVDENKCVVIQNAINPDLEPALMEKNQKKTMSLIYVSSPYRGLIALVPLFDKLLKIFPNLRLKVFSSDSFENSVARDYQPICMDYFMSQSPTLSSIDKYYADIYKMMIQHTNIDYYGNVPQHVLFRHMKESMVMMYPCTFPETCCTSVLEAMACRCFVVSSDLGALRETTNNFGHLYDPCVNVNHCEYKVSDAIMKPVQLTDIVASYQISFITKVKELLIDFYSEGSQVYLDRQQKYIKDKCLWKHRAGELFKCL